MRKSDLINKILLGLTLVFITSCTGLFVLDPIDPELPKYTEEGNDVAGAYVNDIVWQSVVKYFISNSDKPSLTVWPSGDSLVIKFDGDISNGKSTIEFHLKGLKIKKIEDLTLLNDKKIQLDGTLNSGYYNKNYNPTYYANKGIGQIYFKKVRMKDPTLIILSGTFGFTVNEQWEILKISYGRFDYGIDQFRFHIE